jgi:tripeptide aminopeptidase
MGGKAVFVYAGTYQIVNKEEDMEKTFVDWNLLRLTALSRREEIVALAQRICEVPAPTGNEIERAHFVAAQLQERGYMPEMDALGDVYVHRGNHTQRPVVMLMAHLDTVFPAETPIVVRRDGDILRGPGIADNSASVATMLCTLSLLDELAIETPVDLVAVANVGEEGLGNLRGARAAVERYWNRLGAVIAIDGRLGKIVNEAVGSKRWRITVTGPGGHSFGSFGQPSAIHGLGRIIAAIADLKVPSQPKTTYNVGIIEGGTSVNTIAARASALLDMRSADSASLERLAEQVQELLVHAAGAGLQTEVEVLGERPGGKSERSEQLVHLAMSTLRWLGYEPGCQPSSTDANIPISLNIPAVCVGVTFGERAHTLDEFLHIEPLGDGLAQVARLAIEACAMVAATAQQ